MQQLQSQELFTVIKKAFLDRSLKYIKVKYSYLMKHCIVPGM